jgi:hypothetical protein
MSENLRLEGRGGHAPRRICSLALYAGADAWGRSCVKHVRERDLSPVAGSRHTRTRQSWRVRQPSTEQTLGPIAGHRGHFQVLFQQPVPRSRTDLGTRHRPSRERASCGRVSMDPAKSGVGGATRLHRSRGRVWTRRFRATGPGDYPRMHRRNRPHNAMHRMMLQAENLAAVCLFVCCFSKEDNERTKGT